MVVWSRNVFIIIIIIVILNMFDHSVYLFNIDILLFVLILCKVLYASYLQMVCARRKNTHPLRKYRLIQNDLTSKRKHFPHCPFHSLWMLFCYFLSVVFCRAGHRNYSEEQHVHASQTRRTKGKKQKKKNLTNFTSFIPQPIIGA